jgi:hypothetical protein
VEVELRVDAGAQNGIGIEIMHLGIEPGLKVGWSEDHQPGRE